MAKNIVASISEMLTPVIIGNLATASGLDRTVTKAALSAAVPTILNSMAELATTLVGAQKLARTVAQQSNDLDSLSNQLVGSQSADLGNDLLSSMIGRKTTNNLAAGIANLLGIRANAVQTLVGMLTPCILGGLRRVQSAQGLDAHGLARILVDQKDVIADAIPAELSSYLRRSSPADEANPQQPPARPRDHGFALAATPAARSGTDGAKGLSWPYWALALVALGGLLWALIPNEGNELNETASVSLKPVDHQTIATTATGNIPYILGPDRNWRSIGAAGNAYVNRTVFSARGEQLGTVRDLMMGPDGQAAAAIIGVGRYLGIGDKVVAVPFSAIRTEQRDGNPRLVIDLVKEALLVAPQYENTPAPKQ